MYFTNCRVYRLKSNIESNGMDVFDYIGNMQSGFESRQIGNLEMSTIGWAAPMPSNPAISRVVGNVMLLAAERQERLLPGSVISRELKARVDRSIEKAQGRKIGRKERDTIKDEVLHDLIPKAFVRSKMIYGYIDIERNMIVINTQTAALAEEWLNLLRLTLGSLSVEPIATKLPLGTEAVKWMKDHESSSLENIGLGYAADFVDPLAPSNKVCCKDQGLCGSEVSVLLHAGKVVTKIELEVYDDDDNQVASFVVDDELTIKRIRISGVVTEKAGEHGDDDQIFDAELAITVGVVNQIVDSLTDALGGAA